MTPKKIGIVGNEGKFGRWFTEFFKRMGCETMGIDKESQDVLGELVSWSEVVIFCTPLRVTEEIMVDAIPFSKPEQLWMDVAALKSSIRKAMDRGRFEYVGLHPLFAPSTALTWKDEKLYTCYCRLAKWTAWFSEFTEALDVTVVGIPPADHDKYMAGIQNLPHAAALALALTYKELDMNSEILELLSTKLSQKQFSIISRMLSNNPEVYWDIQLMNPSSSMALDILIEHLSALRQSIVDKDREGFMQKFIEARNHMGPHFIGKGLREFGR